MQKIEPAYSTIIHIMVWELQFGSITIVTDNLLNAPRIKEHGVIPKPLTSSRKLFTPTQGLKLHIQFGSVAQTVPYLLKVETQKSYISDYYFVTEPEVRGIYHKPTLYQPTMLDKANQQFGQCMEA
ncbi:hypothetical protein J6590_104591 [Homalodisca vitripennis]|nr:hypothetical protein J6590_104591 [Homalodisca vitripennis]